MRLFDLSILSILAAAAFNISGLPSLKVGPAVSALLSASTSGSKLWPWHKRCRSLHVHWPVLAPSILCLLQVCRCLLEFECLPSLCSASDALCGCWRYLEDYQCHVSMAESICCMLGAVLWGCVQESEKVGLEGLVGTVRLVEVCLHCY